MATVGVSNGNAFGQRENLRSAFEILKGLPPKANSPLKRREIESPIESPGSRLSIHDEGSSWSQSSSPRRSTLPPTPSFPRGDKRKHRMRDLTIAAPVSIWLCGGSHTIWCPDSDYLLLTAQRATKAALRNDNPTAKKPSRYVRPSHRALLTKYEENKNAGLRAYPFSIIRTIGASFASSPVDHLIPNLHLEQSIQKKYVVHLGDPEGWSFVIQTLTPRDSPLFDSAFLYNDLDHWDGSQFVVIPLVDKEKPQHAVLGLKRSPTESVASPNTALDSNDASSGNVASPTNLNYNTFTLEGSKGARNTNSLTSRSTITTLGTVPFYVEKWRRFATVCALYGAAGEANIVDLYALPFVSLFQTKWEILLGDEETQIEIRSGIVNDGVKSLVSGPIKKTERGPRNRMKRSVDAGATTIPVAALRPIMRKGILKTAPVRFVNGRQVTSAPQIIIQPFTDAEIFQLFYLQLIFRAFFDARFPQMFVLLEESLKNRNETRRHILRADHLGRKSSGTSSLAFEHPTNPEKWIRFPAYSSILIFLDLANAVVPLFSDEQEMRETEILPLFGGSPTDTPCVSSEGFKVVTWASTKVVSSFQQAAVLLSELFDVIPDKYVVSKEVVEAEDDVKKFYSSEVKAFASLEFKCGELSRFFAREPGTTSTTRDNTPFTSQSMRLMKEKNKKDTSSSGILEKPTASQTDIMQIASTLSRTNSLKTTSDVVNFEDMIHQRNKIDVNSLSLELRWRQYIVTGNLSIFDGSTQDIHVVKKLGRGGSGIVYSGTFGKERIPVAIKMFILVEGKTQKEYVKECLIDLSFYVLLNQLSNSGVCPAGRAYDFIVSNNVPAGVSEEDVNAACRGAEPNTVHLCYFITDLMDGTLGRFLDETDDDYDPFYDAIVNSSLSEGELFQFLFLQLTCESLFRWKIFDLMLNQQLRGDNIGFRYLDRRASTVQEGIPSLKSYEGIVVEFQEDKSAPVQHLLFPVGSDMTSKEVNDPNGGTPLEVTNPSTPGDLRSIFFIDVGQGTQPNVATLVQNRYIGETMVDSCLNDDGFGRYWPPEKLYCKYVEAKGSLAGEVIQWGDTQNVKNPDDATRCLKDLFELYKPKYGVESPPADARERYVIFSWTVESVEKIKENFVYKA